MPRVHPRLHIYNLDHYGTITVIKTGDSCSLTSTLKEPLPEKNPLPQLNEQQQEHLNILLYNAAIDGMEALLLALANSTADIATTEYQNAIENALESIANHYGE